MDTDTTAAMIPPATQKFVDERPWAKAALELLQGAHKQISDQLDPLVVQPTRHAEDGKLFVQSLNGQAEYLLTCYRGEKGIVSNLVTTVGCIPAAGMLHLSMFPQASQETGMPYLNFELGGNEHCILFAAVMAPRLCTLRHMDYRNKYYRTVPTGASVSLAQLHQRMATRVNERDGVVLKLGMSMPPPTAKGAKAEGNEAEDPHPYQVFHSPQLWTRLMSGHGVLFCFNPSSPASIELVRQDIKDAIALWAGLAADDAAGGEKAKLSGDRLVESKALSTVMANFMDHDEETAHASKIFGEEPVKKMKETVNGVASLAGAPWWSQQ